MKKQRFIQALLVLVLLSTVLIIPRLILWGTNKNPIRNFIIICVLLPCFFYFVKLKGKDRVKNLVYLIIFFLPVCTINLPPTKLNFNLFDYILFLCILLWLPQKKIFKEIIFFRSSLSKPLFLILIAAVISSVFATNIDASFMAILHMTKYFLLYLIIVDVIKDKNDLRIIFLLFGIQLVIISLMGIYQSYFGFNLSLYDKLNPNTVFFTGTNLICRVFGPFSNSLNFAQYLSVGVFFLLFFLYKQKNKFVILLCLFSMFIIIYCLFSTISRWTIAVTLLCFALAYFLLVKRSLGIIIVTLIITIFLLSPNVRNITLEKITSSSLYERAVRFESFLDTGRYEIWSAAIPAFLSDPITGTGLKNTDYNIIWPEYTYRNQDYISPETKGWRPFNFHFENVYIATLINIGIFGLLGLLWLIFRSIKSNYQIFIKNKNPIQKGISIVLFFSMFSIALNMFANPAILSDERCMILFWTLLSFTTVNSKIIINNSNSS